jgi:RNA polymerase sigma-70 factor, ECF subfamily
MRGNLACSPGVEMARRITSSEGRPLDELGDDELVRRTRQGDLAAYEHLIRRYAQLAHRTAVLLAGADAEDAMQEAFVKAYRAIGRYRGEAPFRPWLLRIVANEARNSRRSARRRADLPVRIQAAHGTASSSGEAAPSPEEEAFAHELRTTLLAAVQALPERERRVVTCRYLLELSEAETAAVLDLPQGTVKSRLFRGLRRLRTAPGLAGRFGEEVVSRG